MPLLRLDRHGRNRTSFESGERDRLAGHFAKAIFALVYPAQRSVDLGDKLALAVAGPKLDTPVGFARRAVGNVGFSDRAALELCHRVARFADRSEEHTSELQSLMRISYAVFWLKKKK